LLIGSRGKRETEEQRTSYIIRHTADIIVRWLANSNPDLAQHFENIVDARAVAIAAAIRRLRLPRQSSGSGHAEDDILQQSGSL
jgi:hypothetical protein